ncbi:LOB domain-containing protein 4-like [Coffea arabica]|nr:LOB domain-containing protein 4-like [Coffea arabica]
MKESGRKHVGVVAGGSPCAACKLLRRRCSQECVFAPYFPADEPHKFASVHKVFGASNVNKMLQELPEQQRGDAVSAMVYEANARMRDPVYGCVSAISSLQNQVDLLQSQLALAQAQVLQMRISSTQSSSSLISMSQDQYYNSTTVPTDHNSAPPDHHHQNHSPTASRDHRHLEPTSSHFNTDTPPMMLDEGNIGDSLWSY